MLGLQNLHVSKTSEIEGIRMRDTFSSKNLEFCSWATFFPKKCHFMTINYSKNCQSKIDEVVLQLRFAG
jgi:hypothetical protein